MTKPALVPQRSLFEDAEEFEWENEQVVDDERYASFSHPLPPRLRPRWPDVQYNTTFTLPTLLTNYTLDVVITKFKVQPPGFPKLYPTAVAAEGVYASLPDIVSRNGAVHVVDTLLNPLKKHKHPHHPVEAPSYKPIEDWEHDEELWEDRESDAWEDWEEWLPKWAAQQG